MKQKFFRLWQLLILTILIFNVTNIFADEDAEFKKNKEYSMKEGTEPESSYLLHIDTGINTFYYASFDNNVPDYALSELEYDTFPIVMVYIKFDVSLPACFFRTEFQSNLGLEKGNVESNGQTSEAFDTDKKHAYLLQLAAGLVGIETQFSLSSFETGVIKYKTADADATYTMSKQARNVDADEGFSSIEKKQFDARYHFLWKDIERLGGKSRKTKEWDGYLGYRYLEYETPSIVYVETDDDIMVGESLPQNLVIKTHFAGIGINNYLKAVDSGFNWIVGVEFYIGKGKTTVNFNDYKFNPSILETTYDPAIDRNQKIVITSYVPCASVGFLYNFSNSWVKSSFKLEYKIDTYINKADDYKGNNVVFGHNADSFNSLNASFDFLF